MSKRWEKKRSRIHVVSSQSLLQWGLSGGVQILQHGLNWGIHHRCAGKKTTPFRWHPGGHVVQLNQDRQPGLVFSNTVLQQCIIHHRPGRVLVCPPAPIYFCCPLAKLPSLFYPQCYTCPLDTHHPANMFPVQLLLTSVHFYLAPPLLSFLLSHPPPPLPDAFWASSYHPPPPFFSPCQ